MCQQVINLSIACCQQMGSVIIFYNLVTSTFSLQKAEPERKPLWTLSTSQGSSRLWRRIWRALLHFCQAAEVQRSLCCPLGLIYFHHVYRQGRGVFQLQTSRGRSAEKKCQKKKKPEALFRNGCTDPEAHRQTARLIKVRPVAHLAASLYGPWCWVCCLCTTHAKMTSLSWSISASFIEETPSLCGILLPLNTPGSLFSQCRRLWLPAVSKQG